MEVENDPQDEKHLTISRSADAPMLDAQSSEGEAAPDDEDFIPTKKPAVQPRKKKEKEENKSNQ